MVYSLTLDMGENMTVNTTDRFYTPLLYVVKKHGSLAGACKALGISHQRISHWNKHKSIPDAWKVVLHQKYDVPYKRFFEQLEG